MCELFLARDREAASILVIRQSMSGISSVP